ncbi:MULTISPECIES: DUF3854 domain-containing protein [Clostridium]|uniref:DUF3854 domain-containing protein n=1 Tax=Clostridium TaxID=1485 RepID=UPI0008264579|nr:MULTISPECIES: DUF3854 domain-containing protein [Clostridium]PJI10223.1 hypothetical protein CUB90_21130 [Clostridium sp. CT7]
MSKREDFDNNPRLSILNVADKCRILYRSEGKRFTSVCPFCGASLGHFYLTPDDGKYKNVYRCVKCGEHGSAITLYSKLHNCSTKDAYKELMGFEVNSSTVDFMKEAKKAASVNLYPIASIEVRNKVYRNLIRKLSLSEKHYLNLRNRGLSGKNIIENGYKTLPFDKKLKNKICRELINSGFTLSGIPGFYTDKYNNWTFWTPKEGGFLVPVINSIGQVQGCQIRKDAVKKKYPWFSSSRMECGTQSNGFIHVHWNKSHSSEKVVITEGALKATVASIFSDVTFVAVPGVNSINYLPEVLKLLKAQKIFIAYDMDYKKNEAVQKALNKLKWTLRVNRYNYTQSIWNDEFKGIDDYMLHIVKSKNKKLVM